MARKTATMDARPAPAGPPDRLPRGPEPFTGRRGELAALRARADRPAPGGGCRLLVIAGRPGSGRTALALRFARSYPDSREPLFARLSAPDGSALESGAVARVLLEQLGAQPPQGVLPDDGAPDPACERLRAVLTGRDTLLVLDAVPDAERLAALLPDEPRCLVLAVTEGPLTGLADRWAVDPVILSGLEESAAVELLTGVVGGTRVSCDPVGAAELVEACAGRPAPLRLMAGWLRERPKAAVPDAVAALKAAGAEADAGDPLAAALTLRYRALPVAQARLLRMLTLAPGRRGDLRTASALVGCPAPEAAAALHALAEGELLEEDLPAADGTPRYLVPGRLYGRLLALREELDRPAEVQLARARLLERLVRLVDSARALLEPARTAGADPLPGPLRLRTAQQARQWLLGERDLLLGAVEDAIGLADLDGSAGRLVSALLRTLPLTGEAAPADLYQLHALVLRMAERHGSPRRAAAALLNLADLQAAAGHWEAAALRYRAALEHARQPRDEEATARALEGAAECYRALGDPVRAADWFGRALALRQGLGESAGQARVLVRTAEAHAAQCRFAEAGREYRAALALLRRLGDERGIRAVSAALAGLGE
ncbi:tetratricopeptide (TPR) repeat protein [Kitasatospora sp. MAP12-15]|uniref:AAA family ATPase n=1 Tax=unclassified Kitasatospora TaxID=2633591 RepID=UPI0024750E32|nr:AAA family ATPase [Kitasatospora sp. MAP12-44]MDH6113544.1 tetratricopeptide (TPR) repeat protein [Kitasatospora sp. MAP12-44]